MIVGEDEGPATWSRWTTVLLVVVLVQFLVVVGLLFREDVGFVVMPYYRAASREGDWQSLDGLVRGCLASDTRDQRLAADLKRGLASQDELYRLRNRTHASNVESCLAGARMLGLLTPRERAAVAREARFVVPAADSLRALDEALGR